MMSQFTLLEWLKTGDPAVRRLTEVHLQGIDSPYVTEGWIKTFLEAFDSKTNTWGNGIYGPKWISTFYTIKDLVSLEIDPKHPIFQAGLKTLVDKMWNHRIWKEDDVCVVAMMASMLCYGHWNGPETDEMIEYLFNHRQPDGGWNCQDHHSDKSSVHTTLSALEAFRDYQEHGYTKHIGNLSSYISSGEAFLLKKRLFLSESTGTPMFASITTFHFPTRWFYDVLKALEYFASVNRDYDERMEPALELLKNRFRKGYLSKGITHSGRLHFSMETGIPGRMNTYRGLKVLKVYKPELYHEFMKRMIDIA